jgi:hypothetical protein
MNSGGREAGLPSLDLIPVSPLRAQAPPCCDARLVAGVRNHPQQVILAVTTQASVCRSDLPGVEGEAGSPVAVVSLPARGGPPQSARPRPPGGWSRRRPATTAAPAGHDHHAGALASDAAAYWTGHWHGCPTSPGAEVRTRAQRRRTALVDVIHAGRGAAATRRRPGRPAIRLGRWCRRRVRSRATGATGRHCRPRPDPAWRPFPLAPYGGRGGAGSKGATSPQSSSGTRSSARVVMAWDPARPTAGG